MARTTINGGGRPFGDIYSAGTPYLDQLSNQIYADQKNREMIAQKNNALLDEEFSKNLAQIRNPDVSKLSQAYNDYKQARMAVINKHGVTPEEQMNVLQKKADMYKIIDGSKQKQAQEKYMQQQIGADKTGRFIDDAHKVLIAGMNTPYDQPLTIAGADGKPTQIDWTDPDALGRHIDTKGVMDAITYAQGKPQKYTGDKYKTNPTDLQFQQPEVTVKNTPTDFYNNMRLAATKNPTDFANTLPKPTQDEYNSTLEKYNQLMQNPDVKKNWKINADLPDDADIHTDLEKQLKYQAMTYALNPNNQPQVVVKPVTDLTAKTNQQDQFRKDQQQRAFGQQDHMAAVRNGYSKALYDYKEAKTTGEQDNVLNKFIDNSYNAGTSKLAGANVQSVNVDGKEYHGKIVNIPNSLQSTFAYYDGKKKEWHVPDAFYMTDDKKTMIPIHALKNKQGEVQHTKSGGIYIDPEKTKPVDMQNYKAELSKLLLTKKAAGNEVTGNEDDGSDEFPSAPTMTTTTTKSKTTTKKTAKDYGL